MSDHIPDVTKMISDTPRTDQQNDDLLNSDSYTSWLEISGFARQLERELNVANERIKRLEQVLGTAWYLIANVDWETGKHSHLHSHFINWRDKGFHAVMLRRSKEAKP